MLPFLAYFFGEDRAKPVPLIANGFMIDVDPMLVEQIFYIAQRKWKSDIHHHSETNYLRRRLEIAEGIVIFHPQTLWI